MGWGLLNVAFTQSYTSKACEYSKVYQDRSKSQMGMSSGQEELEVGSRYKEDHDWWMKYQL